jgi:hypothetical protein
MLYMYRYVHDDSRSVSGAEHCVSNEAATVADVSFAIQDASGLHLKSGLIACVLEQARSMDWFEGIRDILQEKNVFFHIFH